MGKSSTPDFTVYIMIGYIVYIVIFDLILDVHICLGKRSTSGTLLFSYVIRLRLKCFQSNKLIAYWVIFHAFLSSAIFFQSYFFFKFFQEYHRLDPDQARRFCRA